MTAVAAKPVGIDAAALARGHHIKGVQAGGFIALFSIFFLILWVLTLRLMPQTLVQRLQSLTGVVKTQL